MWTEAASLPPPLFCHHQTLWFSTPNLPARSGNDDELGNEGYPFPPKELVAYGLASESAYLRYRAVECVLKCSEPWKSDLTPELLHKSAPCVFSN